MKPRYIYSFLDVVQAVAGGVLLCSSAHWIFTVAALVVILTALVPREVR
jgi:hypothetical protein